MNKGNRYVEMLKSKIHRATVTEANLNYTGSLTLDTDFMARARLHPHEKVLVINIERGGRFETYVIPGEAGSRTVCLNGGAAHFGQPGDKIIVMSFIHLTEEEAETWEPVRYYPEEEEG